MKVMVEIEVQDIADEIMRKLAEDGTLVEVVRCKECKWCDDAGKGRALICTNEYIDTDCHPDFYCGYGKRKD